MRDKKNFTPLMTTLAVLILTCFTVPVYADSAMTPDDFINECGQKTKKISAEEGKKLFEEAAALFLDCRTEKEFKRGSIPNATLLQRGLIEFKIGKQVPDKNTTVVVYCKSGKRSALSTCTLTKMGYTNILSLSGGWEAWVGAGYPVN